MPGFSQVMRAVIVLLLLARTAAADDKFAWSAPEPGYLWNGGAVPFLYLPLAGYLTIRSQYEPRDEPLMFSRREGGQRYDGGQYPTPFLYVDAGVVAGVIALGGDDSRWFHLKGFAQGLAMTQFLTVLAKSTVGRHRPSYDLAPGADNAPDQKKSFWSGHASSTLATATYLGLYLRQHLFDRWRPHGTFTWWEGAAYLGLAAATLSIPYSQYHLNRHHASDVIIGSAVGAAVATTFYFYQERRYQHDQLEQPSLFERHHISIAPEPAIRGFAVTGTW